MEYFFEGDEPYPMASITEPPEFAISDRDKYNVANPQDYGPTTFMTN